MSPTNVCRPQPHRFGVTMPCNRASEARARTVQYRFPSKQKPPHMACPAPAATDASDIRASRRGQEPRHRGDELNGTERNPRCSAGARSPAGAGSTRTAATRWASDEERRPRQRQAQAGGAAARTIEHGRKSRLNCCLAHKWQGADVRAAGGVHLQARISSKCRAHHVCAAPIQRGFRGSC